MTNTNDARRAHDVLDGLSTGRILSRENEQLLRSFLPELPKQKTLKELIALVYDAWTRTSGNEWSGNIDSPDVFIEDWLSDLYVQMKGLKDVPAAVPALPDGMRLADHEVYGRVVTSPKPDQDGVYVLLVPRPKVGTGADWQYAHECELTFVDAAPAAPAHPEFLETEADYEDAPEGTMAGVDSTTSVFQKYDNGRWRLPNNDRYFSDSQLAGIPRRVLRWGWGE